MSLLSETTSGKRANHTGNQLEKFVEDALLNLGYTHFWDHKRQLFANREAVGGKQYGKHVFVGNTIYKTKRIVDFLVLNSEKFPKGLIIECKWQQSKGSVDEKYPFLLFNILETGVPTIVLLDGKGYKPAAKQWLADHAGKERALIAVYDMMEFHREINNGLLG